MYFFIQYRKSIDFDCIALQDDEKELIEYSTSIDVLLVNSMRARKEKNLENNRNRQKNGMAVGELNGGRKLPIRQQPHPRRLKDESKS